MGRTISEEEPDTVSTATLWRILILLEHDFQPAVRGDRLVVHDPAPAVVPVVGQLEKPGSGRLGWRVGEEGTFAKGVTVADRGCSCQAGIVKWLPRRIRHGGARKRFVQQHRASRSGRARDTSNKCHGRQHGDQHE